MARELDLANLSEDDVPWLIQQPWKAAQALHEGYDLPHGWYVAKNIPDPRENILDEHNANAGPPEGQQPGPVLGDPDDEDPDDEDPEDDDEAVDYEPYTAAELRGFLTERGLSTTGNKADLIARLVEDDDVEEEDDDEEEEEPASGGDAS